jgi:hypothetical protein
MRNSSLSAIIVILGLLLIGSLFYLFETIKIKKQPKVDLPEEWMLIDPSSKLTGYITKDSVLVIRFYETPDDVVEFQWDGDEKDIPFEKGSRIEVAGSDRNIIYLVPIDE